MRTKTSQDDLGGNIETNVSRYMEVRGWSYETLAEEASVNIHQFHSARDLSMDDLAAVATALGVSAWELTIPTNSGVNAHPCPDWCEDHGFFEDSGEGHHQSREVTVTRDKYRVGTFAGFRRDGSIYGREVTIGVAEYAAEGIPVPDAIELAHALLDAACKLQRMEPALPMH